MGYTADDNDDDDDDNDEQEKDREKHEARWIQTLAARKRA